MKPNFRRLRLRLTATYMVAVLAIIAFVGVGSYGLLRYYFQTNTDLALQHRMAEEFTRAGAGLPIELFVAERNWAGNSGRLVPQVFIPPGLQKKADRGTTMPPSGGSPEDPADESAAESAGEYLDEEHDAELAAMFTLPLDAEGRLVAGAAADSLPLDPQPPAVAAALATGKDLRNVTATDGSPVRLLTYRLPPGGTVAVLQVGRDISDQSLVLGQLLFAVLVLSGVAAVAVGGISWALAGRSLLPLRAAWEQQQSFIANVSHELRTPLTMIRAGTQLALCSITPEPEAGPGAQPEAPGSVGAAAAAPDPVILQDILEECDHLNQLVEDLMLLSRLDAGRLELDLQELDTGVLVGDMQRQFGRLAEAKGVQVVGGETAGMLRADPTRLRQVMLILLDNALRHTPSGGRIEIAAVPSGRYISLTVADTGEGIAAEHLSRLFDRFYQVDTARSGDGRGNGLGLAIAGGLVRAQGGEITLESEPGSGTTVTVRLPRAR